MIRLPHGYNGRLVNNQSVPPGDYAEDDPRLCGIADYLVANRFAIRLDASEAVEPAPASTASPASVPEFLEGRVTVDPDTGAWRTTVQTEATPETDDPQDDPQPKQRGKRRK